MGGGAWSTRPVFFFRKRDAKSKELRLTAKSDNTSKRLTQRMCQDAAAIITVKPGSQKAVLDARKSECGVEKNVQQSQRSDHNEATRIGRSDVPLLVLWVLDESFNLLQ